MKTVHRTVLLLAAVCTCAVSSQSHAVAEWTQLGGNAGHSGYVSVSLDATRLSPSWFSALNYQATPYYWQNRGVVVDGQRVYRTALEGQSVNGTYHINALDLATGNNVWEFTTTGAAYDGVSQPVVSGGTVFVNRAGSQSFPGFVGPDSPSIYALNASTGVVVYQSTYAAQNSSGDAPTVVGNSLAAGGGYYGGLYGYNSSTGGINWHINPGTNYAETNHAADSDYLYVGATARNFFDGNIVRTMVAPSGNTLGGPITNGDGSVLYTTNNSSGMQGLALFNSHSGSLIWEDVLPTGGAGGARAIGGDYVVTRGAYDANALYIVDARTGQLLREWHNDRWLNAYDIVLTNSHAFVRDEFNTYAVRLSTGEREWSYPMSGQLALSNGYLFISNADGVLALSVPEPSALQLFLMGAVGFFVSRLRRSRR